MRLDVVVSVFSVAALWAVCADAQWGQFRGPNGTGVAPSGGFPGDLAPATQARWKVAVPFGQSSPVVAGDRVYVTASEGDRLVTLSLDAGTGREVWRREIARVHAHKIYRSNDPASPTPVADADGVVAFFPDFGLVAYARDGAERWRHPLGPFRNFYGMAASPVVVDGLVVLVCDQQTGSFILALDRASGAVQWKRDRPGRTVGWATPIVFRASGRSQLVVLGSTHVDGYDLGTGVPTPRWWMRVASNGGLGTPVISGDTVLVSTLAATEPWIPAFPSVAAKYDRDKDLRLSPEEFKTDDLAEHFGWLDDNSDGFVDAREWNVARDMGTGEFGVLAIRPGEATGQLAPTAIRWRFQKNLPFVAAPLIYQDVIYLVRDGGIITTVDPSTGQLLKEGRTKEALGQYFASPVAADGKVYLASSEGKVTVIRAGAQWEVLGVSDFGDEISATPALGDGRVYVRTRGALYCFGAR